MKQYNFLGFILLFSFLTGTLKAQSSCNIAGYSANGINGKVSCSIGQPFFIINSTASGKVKEGIQQPLALNAAKHLQPDQMVFVSAGLSGSGINEKFSFTIGQPFYILKTSENEELREGIQQPVPVSFLNVNVFLQGFYRADLGTMVEIIGPGLTDTIIVSIHTATAPYIELYSSQVLLDIHGKTNLLIPSAFRGSNCYIVIRHRNHVQTWSKNPVLLTANTLFDFTQ